MSADKHKGVERRKFALANIHKVTDGNQLKLIRNFGGEYVDIQKDVRVLVKSGAVKRVRHYPLGKQGKCNRTLFKQP